MPIYDATNPKTGARMSFSWEGNQDPTNEEMDALFEKQHAQAKAAVDKVANAPLKISPVDSIMGKIGEGLNTKLPLINHSVADIANGYNRSSFLPNTHTLAKFQDGLSRLTTGQPAPDDSLVQSLNSSEIDPEYNKERDQLKVNPPQNPHIKGLSDSIGGALALSPFTNPAVLGSMVASPIKAVVGLGTGVAGGYAGQQGAKMAGLSPEAQELTGLLAGVGVGGVASHMVPEFSKGGIVSSPKVNEPLSVDTEIPKPEVKSPEISNETNNIKEPEAIEAPPTSDEENFLSYHDALDKASKGEFDPNIHKYVRELGYTPEDYERDLQDQGVAPDKIDEALDKAFPLEDYGKEEDNSDLEGREASVKGDRFIAPLDLDSSEDNQPPIKEIPYGLSDKKSYDRLVGARSTDRFLEASKDPAAMQVVKSVKDSYFGDRGGMKFKDSAYSTLKGINPDKDFNAAKPTLDAIRSMLINSGVIKDGEAPITPQDYAREANISINEQAPSVKDKVLNPVTSNNSIVRKYIENADYQLYRKPVANQTKDLIRAIKDPFDKEVANTYVKDYSHTGSPEDPTLSGFKMLDRAIAKAGARHYLAFSPRLQLYHGLKIINQAIPELGVGRTIQGAAKAITDYGGAQKRLNASGLVDPTPNKYRGFGEKFDNFANFADAGNRTVKSIMLEANRAKFKAKGYPDWQQKAIVETARQEGLVNPTSPIPLLDKLPKIMIQYQHFKFKYAENVASAFKQTLEGDKEGAAKLGRYLLVNVGLYYAGKATGKELQHIAFNVMPSTPQARALFSIGNHLIKATQGKKSRVLGGGNVREKELTKAAQELALYLTPAAGEVVSKDKTTHHYKVHPPSLMADSPK